MGAGLDERPISRARFRLGLAGVALLAALSHARSLGNGLVYDDLLAVQDNPVVHAPFDARALATRDFWGRPAATSHVGTWRPLPLASFWIDAHTGGAPWRFHLTNLLCHAVAALFLALALARHTGRPRLALLSAALFAALAIDSEAVDAIVGRADLLAAALGFLAWHLAGRADDPPRPGRALASGLALLGALLCKESALIVPVAILAADRLLALPPARPRLLSARYLALALAALAALGLRLALYGPGAVARSAINNPLVGQPLPIRLWTGLRLFLLALRLVLFPLNLSPDYSFAEILPERSPLSLDVLAGAAALALLVALAIALRRRAPAFALAAALFVVPWAAASNVPWTLPTPLAERLLYLPAAGAALALAASIDRTWTAGRRGFALAIAALFFGGNLALGALRDGDWHDPLALFSSAAEVCPRSARVWTNLGVALLADGRRDDGVAALERAVAISPDGQLAQAMLGVALAQSGRPGAEEHLRRAVALDPDDEEAAQNLAVYLARAGRAADAAAVLRERSLRAPLSPRSAALLDRLGRN